MLRIELTAYWSFASRLLCRKTFSLTFLCRIIFCSAYPCHRIFCFVDLHPRTSWVCHCFASLELEMKLAAVLYHRDSLMLSDSIWQRYGFSDIALGLVERADSSPPCQSSFGLEALLLSTKLLAYSSVPLIPTLLWERLQWRMLVREVHQTVYECPTGREWGKTIVSGGAALHSSHWRSRLY